MERNRHTRTPIRRCRKVRMNQTLEIQDEVLRNGFGIHKLIFLLELHTEKDISKRDKYWLLRFKNLLKTLEGSTGNTYSFLQHELNITQQKVEISTNNQFSINTEDNKK